MDRLLNPAEIAEIRDLAESGFRTVQAMQDTPEVVTFDRAGDVVAADVHLIRIRLDDRQGIEQTVLQGATETRLRGTLKGWATDLANVRTGDRFRWGRTPCRVVVVETPRFGAIDIRFETLGGGR